MDGARASRKPDVRRSRVAPPGLDPDGRLGTPAGVGNLIALLCGAEEARITGQLIVADGGASLMNAEMPAALQLG
jgi:NAD(P)-dependent dehydrogenase (short-subunit alcohol dehydrogenase family)